MPLPLRKSPPWHMKLGIWLGVSSLTHSTARQGWTCDAVELGALVALGLAAGVLGLAGAELAEILGRLGNDVLEKLEGNTAKGFA